MKPVNYSDLRPKKSKIKLLEKTYILKPFSIGVETWAYYEFQTKDERNGMNVLSERLRDFNDKEALLKTLHKLIIDKEDFPEYEDFLKLVETLGQEKIYLFLMEGFYSIAETIGLSQPIIENIEEELELKKLKAAKQE